MDEADPASSGDARAITVGQSDVHQVRDAVGEPDRRAVHAGGAGGDPARVVSALGSADPKRAAGADTDLHLDLHVDIHLDIDGRPQPGTV